ncbi:MAG: hypothetical protein WC053_00450 [Sideroxydans sp.]|jgi:hypothetical protein
MTQPHSIPLLTEVVPDTTDDLPVLTDIAPDTPPAPASSSSPDTLPGLQQTLETYIETVFADKLKTHLATANQWAIEAAIAELKNELPQLIRKAQERTSTD